jgi:hypothetical protein
MGKADGYRDTFPITLSTLSNRKCLELCLHYMVKLLLRLFLASSIFVTLIATGASFVWYIQEYDMAYALYKTDKEASNIHRTNSLWLGLWGGVYGLISVTSAGFLLLDILPSEKSNIKP